MVWLIHWTVTWVCQVCFSGGTGYHGLINKQVKLSSGCNWTEKASRYGSVSKLHSDSCFPLCFILKQSWLPQSRVKRQCHWEMQKRDVIIFHFSPVWKGFSSTHRASDETRSVRAQERGLRFTWRGKSKPKVKFVEASPGVHSINKADRWAAAEHQQQNPSASSRDPQEAGHKVMLT